MTDSWEASGVPPQAQQAHGQCNLFGRLGYLVTLWVCLKAKTQKKASMLPTNLTCKALIDHAACLSTHIGQEHDGSWSLQL